MKNKVIKMNFHKLIYRYSYRNASIGSRSAAFLAGYHPKKTPVTVHTANDSNTLQGCINTGHGAPFNTVDAAFDRAFRRLGNFRSNIEQLAWHAIKVIVSFAMMEKRQVAKADFPAFVLSLPFAVDVNTRFLNLSDEALVTGIERQLLLVNALQRQDGMIMAA